MKVTKYEHACMVLEEDGKKLVIDPGEFTQSLGDVTKVVAVVITHDHFDHLSKDQVAAILTANPDATVFGTQSVINQLGAEHKVVTDGDEHTVEPFTLKFVGELHALIHDDLPHPGTNVGVLVNGVFYFPGDSFDAPDGEIQLLALPVSGPWLKVGDVIDFVNKVKPRQVFGTHDGLNNQAANGMMSDMVKPFVEKNGGALSSLAVGESLEF